MLAYKLIWAKRRKEFGTAPVSVQQQQTQTSVAVNIVAVLSGNYTPAAEAWIRFFQGRLWLWRVWTVPIVDLEQLRRHTQCTVRTRPNQSSFFDFRPSEKTLLHFLHFFHRRIPTKTTVYPV